MLIPSLLLLLATRTHALSFDDDLTLEGALSGLNAGGLESLRGLVVIVRDQFRLIVEESLRQLWKYLKEQCALFKTMLTKRLARWSLSDVVRAVFDGLDFETERAEATTATEAAQAHTERNYGFFPYGWRELLEQGQS